ncbi:MAG: PRC-barrel domain-containing protein [Paracoccaceae bacterium]
MLTSAAIAAFAVPAAAQDGSFRAEMSEGSVRASDLIGAHIYASASPLDNDAYAGIQDDWTDIGEISDVIVTREGSVEAVLADIGGFLGMGERQIAVNMTALHFVADKATTDDSDVWFVVMTADKATLAAAPLWSVPASDMRPVEAAAGKVADSIREAGADTARAISSVAEGDAPMKATAADGGTHEGYTAVAGGALTAAILKGAVAFDADEANVGEVGELILSGDGMVSNVVIDVGGFLGIGEKHVRLSLDQMSVFREDGGSGVRVYLSLTKAQLQAMPEHRV